MSETYDTLRVTRAAEGAVVTVEMHRPAALNAMNTAMGRELLTCFDALFWDKQTRVVILTGAGDKA
jgi:enoyl-CoA hydratase